MGTVVRNHTRQPVAAMSISMPIQRLRGENLITSKEHLLNAANRLSAELGYDSRAVRSDVSHETAPAEAAG
jgi:DNA-binding IclR family transcriptional regulator